MAELLAGQHYEATVSVPSRTHWGLLDCGYASNRLFGGVGAAVEGFRTIVRAEFVGDEGGITYSPVAELDPDLHMSDRTVEELGEIVDRFKEYNLGRTMQLSILQTAPEHIGLGSKTSLEMATVYALGSLLLSAEGNAIRHELAGKFISRGGTSRIGVIACAKGGIIFDDGHGVDGEKRIFLPSSSRAPVDKPSENVRVKLDDDYRIQLFYDATTPRIDGQREVGIFEQHMPFSDIEGLRSIAAAYHGILPALLRRDMPALSKGLRDLNSIGLKEKEVSLQSLAAQDWLQNSWDNQLPVGLSSFGPILFCLGRNTSEELILAQSIAMDKGLRYLGDYPLDNKGMRVRIRQVPHENSDAPEPYFPARRQDPYRRRGHVQVVSDR